MLYNEITAREQKPLADLLKNPQITVNTLTSLLPLSHNCHKHRKTAAAMRRFFCFFYFFYRNQIRYTASAACTAIMAGTPQRNSLCSVL